MNVNHETLADRLSAVMAQGEERLRQQRAQNSAAVAELLLETLQPDRTRLQPATAIAQFDPATPPAQRLRLPRHTVLRTQAPRAGAAAQACRFLTACDVDLWPVEIAQVEYVSDPAALASTEARAGCRMRLRIPDSVARLTFADLEGFDVLRFHLHAEHDFALELYDALLDSGTAAMARSARAAAAWSAARFAPAGLTPAESLLPADPRVLPAERLLRDYFVLPEKLLFVELQGLSSAASAAGRELELLLTFSGARPALRGLRADHLRLGCVPVVNLFRPEPKLLRLEPSRSAHPLTIDSAASNAEIYAVESLELREPEQPWRPCRPLYAAQALAEADANIFYRVARARRADEEDPRGEFHLMLADARTGGLPAVPLQGRLRVWATNGAAASRLVSNEWLLSDQGMDARLLGAPTAALRPSRRPVVGVRRLVERLDRLQARETEPQALLRAALLENAALDFDPEEPCATEAARRTWALAQINGITEVQIQHREVPRANDAPPAFLRLIVLTLDARVFSTGGARLFGAAVNEFLTQNQPADRYTTVAVKTTEGGFHQWPARNGLQNPL